MKKEKELLTLEQWILQYRSQDVIDYVNERLNTLYKLYEEYIKGTFTPTWDIWDSYTYLNNYSYLLNKRSHNEDYSRYCIDELLKCGVLLINIERKYINLIIDNTVYCYKYTDCGRFINILHINYPKVTILDTSKAYSKWLPRITSSETFINLLDLINSNAIECKTNYDFIKLLNNL